MEEPQLLADRILENIGRVIIGKSTETRLALIALLCRGHLLIEDVPGVGKTMLARALARSTGCTFSRIQFTPDLLPSDVTGVSDLRAGDGNLRVPGGPRDGADRPHRRDQPRDAEDTVRPARVDGGAPGHRRRHHAPSPAPLHGDGDAEPHRVRGHVPAARGPARPLPDARPARLSERRRRGARHGRAAGRPPHRHARPGDPSRRGDRAPGGGGRDLRRPGSSSSTSSIS